MTLNTSTAGPRALQGQHRLCEHSKGDDEPEICQFTVDFGGSEEVIGWEHEVLVEVRLVGLYDRLDRLVLREHRDFKVYSCLLEPFGYPYKTQQFKVMV